MENNVNLGVGTNINQENKCQKKERWTIPQPETIKKT